MEAQLFFTFFYRKYSLAVVPYINLIIKCNVQLCKVRTADNFKIVHFSSNSFQCSVSDPYIFIESRSGSRPFSKSLSGSRSRFLMTEKTFSEFLSSSYLLIKKCNIGVTLFILRPQKRTSSTSKLEYVSSLFLGSFCLPGSRDPLNPDPKHSFLIVTFRCFTLFEGYLRNSYRYLRLQRFSK
jgi:hypothetical protein